MIASASPVARHVARRNRSIAVSQVGVLAAQTSKASEILGRSRQIGKEPPKKYLCVNGFPFLRLRPVAVHHAPPYCSAMDEHGKSGPIVIAGGSGFLGLSLATHLTQSGFSVVIL